MCEIPLIDAMPQIRLEAAALALMHVGAREARVDAIGPNGPQILGLEGNWPLAMAMLERCKDADVLGVFTNSETGDSIDFHWGFTSENPKEKGQGLAKLLRWHGDVVQSLDKIIEAAVLVSRPKPDRYILSDGKHLIIVSLRHNADNKRWLLTAFNAGPKPSKKDRALLYAARKKIGQATNRTVDGASIAGQTNASIAGAKSTDRLA